MRGILLAVVLTLLCAGLGGCATRAENYCAAVKSDQAQLRSLAVEAGRPGQDVVSASVDIFTELADKAPEDVNDDWDTFVFAWQGLQRALTAADVDPTDYRSGTRPRGVSSAEYRAITQAAEELRSPGVVEAADRIQRHAIDVCKVDLGL